jgi:hypothetical protein
MDPLQIAEAFSGHRFTETYDGLAANVRWVLPGHPPIEGKEAVVSACDFRGRRDGATRQQ